jgi:poly-beta-1,6-N-acetyl-D-glucosamine synthase
LSYHFNQIKVEEFISNLGLYEYILLIILSFALLLQLVYYLAIFIRVPSFKESSTSYSNQNYPVSVVICAKNEAENITAYLPIILEQDYPNFEVIVVNDCSDDDTQDILETLQEKYPHLRTTQIKHDEKFTHGKKLALTIGIKAAKHEWLLLTDADCKPEGKQWIRSMQRNFIPSCDIVLGYGGYYHEKGFLNKLIRFDTFFIALQYLSMALIKMPYMGVGRNLAYRKSLFMENKGFASHAHIQSGDDDLFINEVAIGKTTRVEFSANSHTRSVPKKTFYLWGFQKSRHLSTGKSYKSAHKIVLGGEIFSRFLFYASIFLLLINPFTWIIGLSAYIFRMIIQLSVFNGAMKKFNEKKLLLFSIIFDFILPLLYLFWYFSITINSKQHKWK